LVEPLLFTTEKSRMSNPPPHRSARATLSYSFAFRCRGRGSNPHGTFVMPSMMQEMADKMDTILNG
jgi:hypothetical protein